MGEIINFNGYKLKKIVERFNKRKLNDYERKIKECIEKELKNFWEGCDTNKNNLN